MATVKDLIEAALRDIGVLASSEAATASDAADGLVALNRLLDQWALEPLTIYTLTRTTKAITANDGEYSVGSGGDVNIARPIWVERVTLIDTNQDPDHEYPLRRLTEREYQEWPDKAGTAAQPETWYYNPTYATATLYLFPVPTGSGLQFAMYNRTAVPQFSAATSTVTLPPGYERMLVKNLALELAPSYGRQVPAVLAAQAADAKAAVKRANQRAVLSEFPADVPGVSRSSGSGYSIRRG